MKLVTVAEMRAIEEEANDQGYTYDLMMDKAGKGVANKIIRLFGQRKEKRITAVIGTGNNGGDALVAVDALINAGWQAKVFLVKTRNEDPLFEKLVKQDVETYVFASEKDLTKLNGWMEDSDVLLDGLLGTGIKLPLREPYPAIIEAIRKYEKVLEIVSVDCPSGVDCDSGEAAENCIKADHTICMEAIKIGLLKFPAYKYVGQLDVVELGLPVGLKAENAVIREVATADCVQRLLPQRPLEAHKGTFGTAFVIAGSINYTGAALLAGKAAYRIGAGLVQMGVPGPLYSALAGIFPEATWVLLPHDMGVIKSEGAALVQKNLDKATAMLMGPGWGQEDTTKEFLEQIIVGKASSQKRKSGIGFVMMDSDEKEQPAVDLPPLVIDADGLKLLQKISNWEKKLPELSVLTPHPGEMAVLTGLSVKDIQNNRLEIAKEYAEKWNQVLVLKGAMTVVSAPNGKQSVVPVANPALARAGTGDVLAGIITGLIAQGITPYDASVAGVWIHAQAGVAAAEMIGHPASVLAGDVLEAIPKVLERLG